MVHSWMMILRCLTKRIAKGIDVSLIHISDTVELNLLLDIKLPALANLCRSVYLVTSWMSSAKILHHHAKRIFSPECNWKLVHIASLRPQSPLPGQNHFPHTSLDTLKDTITGGLKPDSDDAWMGMLPQDRLNEDATKQGTIHSEAMLMALAHNPSLPSIRNVGIEEACSTTYIRRLPY